MERSSDLSQSRTQDVWVTGDQTIDWVLKPEGRYITRNPEERLHGDVKLYWHAGGAFQLASLTQAAMLHDGQGIPQVTPSPQDEVWPRQDKLTAYRSRFSHSFALMNSYESGICRIEQFFGFRHHGGQPRPADPKFTPPNTYKGARVIIIDDANLGFRSKKTDRSGKTAWEPVLKHAMNPNCQWVLLKMSHDLGEAEKGTLWHEIDSLLTLKDGDEEFKRKLHDALIQKLIVVTAVARLRDVDAEVSKGLSWDQSAQDVLYEISKHKKLATLRACPRLVVSFGPSGAMFIEHDRSQGQDALKWHLVYIREQMEKEWADEHRSGLMFGYGSVLSATLASELAAHPKEPQFDSALKRALVAMHQLYDQGFTLIEDEDGSREFEVPDSIFNGTSDTKLHERLRLCVTPSRPRVEATYTRTTDFSPILKPASLGPKQRMHIARKGKEALPDHIPIGCFGNLVTVDHQEIEALHQIYNLIGAYCTNVRLDAKPLAVAVFGPPGSGKGYTLKQLATPWTKANGAKKGALKFLEFNLSQLNSASELVGALHQVRDIALDGQVPLVLWDEFDSPLQKQPLGWLRYFLAPIQDGKFQQEEATHLIGPSVFVFAGGTAESFGDFKAAARKIDTKGSGLKSEDFLSRLRGFVDIYSINELSPDSEPGPAVMLRRALTLNSLLRKYEVAELPDQGFDVEEGLLKAFLEVPKYEHGVRSMEAIIQMSHPGSGEKFTGTLLPSHEQLRLHVNPAAFLGKVRSYNHD